MPDGPLQRNRNTNRYTNIRAGLEIMLELVWHDAELIDGMGIVTVHFQRRFGVMSQG